jgi:3',5'-cyclic AMP phosphodiesterase CpdA
MGNNERKHKKRSKARAAWKIVGIILCSVFLVVGVCATIGYVGSESNKEYAESTEKVVKENALAAPKIDNETGYWTFTSDRDLTVMQLTDVHIGGGFLSLQKDNWAISAVASLVQKVKPDLIIVTGDIAYPVPFQSGTFNNLTPVREFTALMESLGVYWTFVFGNHDTEAYSFYNREYISDYYENQIKAGKLKYCLYQSGYSGIQNGYENGENDAGYGNTVIEVKNGLGVITQSLILFDSHSYEKGFLHDYDHIHQCQIDWYANQINSLNSMNKKAMDKAGISYAANEMTVKSLAFFHIPLQEYRTAYLEWQNNGKKDTDNVKLKYGIVGETGELIYCGITADNLFETMLALGSTQGLFCGHDHLNNFSLDYNGGSGNKYIRLTYGLSIDYLAYYGIAAKTAQRGCTVITVKTDGAFDCYGLRLSDFGIVQ